MIGIIPCGKIHYKAISLFKFGSVGPRLKRALYKLGTPRGNTLDRINYNPWIFPLCMHWDFARVRVGCWLLSEMRKLGVVDPVSTDPQPRDFISFNPVLYVTPLNSSLPSPRLCSVCVACVFADGRSNSYSADSVLPPNSFEVLLLSVPFSHYFQIRFPIGTTTQTDGHINNTAEL